MESYRSARCRKYSRHSMQTKCIELKICFPSAFRNQGLKARYENLRESYLPENEVLHEIDRHPWKQ